MIEDTNYYVYIYLDPRKPGLYKCDEIFLSHKPFYIGKGKNDRCFDHLKEKNAKNTHKKRVLNKIFNSKQSPIIFIYKQNISQLDAFDLEKNLINFFSIKTLTNMTLGGLDGDTYSYRSEEEKYKTCSKLKQNYIDNPQMRIDAGLKTTERYEDSEYCEMMSSRIKEGWSNTSEEIRLLRNQHISETRSKQSEDQRNKISKELRNRNKSYMQTEEYKKSISEAFLNKLIEEINPYLTIIKQGLERGETKKMIRDNVDNIISGFRLNKVIKLINEGAL